MEQSKTSSSSSHMNTAAPLLPSAKSGPRGCNISVSALYVNSLSCWRSRKEDRSCSSTISTSFPFVDICCCWTVVGRQAGLGGRSETGSARWSRFMSRTFKARLLGSSLRKPAIATCNGFLMYCRPFINIEKSLSYLN